MEDFGYKKNNSSDNKNNFLLKKIFLVSATLLSLSAFFYITMNAYYFMNENNNKEIETVKGPESPIKVYEDNDYNQNNDRIINRSIYDDIFGNRKEIIREDIKIKKNSEPPLPPASSTNTPSKQNDDITTKTISDQENVDKSSAQQNNQDVGANNINDNSPNDNNKNAETANNNPPITLQNQANPTKPKPRRRSSIKVQISAMSSKENCEEYFYKLRKLHPEVFSGTKYYVEEDDLGKRGIFYRLQIGDFFNQIDAEEFCKRFISQTQKSSSECIIVE